MWVPRSLAGLWTGTHPGTWKHLEAQLPGGRYIGSGAALKRYDSWQEAVDRFGLDCPSSLRGGFPVWRHCAEIGDVD